tara:strand:+ start:9640 stop:10596 length:957 start_codon:yes stop_codon:yes gene_type:complete
MNVETTIDTPSNQNLSHQTRRAKSAVLLFSLLLGACATTGDNLESVAEAKTAPAKESVQKQDKAPAPSAAELMETLKAPLVEPPEAKVTPEKVKKAKPTPAAALEDVKRKVTESSKEVNKKQAEVKIRQPEKVDVKEKIVETPVVVEIKTAEKPVEGVQRKVTEKAAEISAKPFNVSANKLPFNYDIWTIRQGNTPLTKGLVIATPTWEMGETGYTSQIWLTMMEDKLHVNSSSDIETASKGLGIRIDGGDLIPFSSIADDSIGVIKGQWLNKLAAANKIDIYLGFFPGKKPTSKTFSSDLSLKNLARMIATYRMLNQ